jgi:low affinity Fe/Cu permease
MGSATSRLRNLALMGRAGPLSRRSEMLTILVIVLVLILFGVLPTWPHSRSWGYYPSGGVAIVIVLLVVLLLMGRI